jgi:cell division protein FtsL
MIKSSFHNLVKVAVKKLASSFFMSIFTFLGLVVLAVSVVLMITLQALRIVIAYTNTGYRDRSNPPLNIMPCERSSLERGSGLYNN